MLIVNRGFRAQRGINLIELMVGIAISLVLLTGVLSVMLRISTSGGEIVQSTRLNQQMRGALDLMSKELQRAGYVDWMAAWDQDDDGVLTLPADDVTGDGNLDILDYYQAVLPVLNDMGRITIDGSCILYRYDIGPDQFNLFGFRLNDGAIEMKTSGDHSCDTNVGWQDVTDPTVTITELTFTLEFVDDVDAGDSSMYAYTFDPDKPDPEFPKDLLTSCDPAMAGDLPADGDVLCLARRSVRIDMAGELATDPEVTMSLQTIVKIRNDYYNSNP